MSESVLIIGTPDSCKDLRIRLLPERKISKYSDAGNSYRNGWNACLDEIYKLNFETEEESDE